MSRVNFGNNTVHNIPAGNRSVHPDNVAQWERTYGNTEYFQSDMQHANAIHQVKNEIPRYNANGTTHSGKWDAEYAGRQGYFGRPFFPPKSGGKTRRNKKSRSKKSRKNRIRRK
jgi:hypothetical protein